MMSPSTMAHPSISTKQTRRPSRSTHVSEGELSVEALDIGAAHEQVKRPRSAAQCKVRGARAPMRYGACKRRSRHRGRQKRERDGAVGPATGRRSSAGGSAGSAWTAQWSGSRARAGGVSASPDCTTGVDAVPASQRPTSRQLTRWASRDDGSRRFVASSRLFLGTSRLGVANSRVFVTTSRVKVVTSRASVVSSWVHVVTLRPFVVTSPSRSRTSRSRLQKLRPRTHKSRARVLKSPPFLSTWIAHPAMCRAARSRSPARGG
jgi:hypothetical protein